MNLVDAHISSLQADEWNEGETPVVSALIHMAAKDQVSLHVPGHKQGRLFPSSLSAWMGRSLQLDLTELPGLDNLHQPEGCIRQSEQLAASHYGATETLYSVNGSSAAVMAAVMSAAANRRILVAGSFHQSLWKGLVLADAEPVLIPPEFDREWMEVVPPTPLTIASALKEHPDVAAVFVTSPTYHGRIADIRAIAEAVHQASVPLIVDEAHGAHLGLADGLPPHSVHSGADVVIQSVHKVLPALTQTAWMHLQGPYIDRALVRQCLLMLQTTSPSYLLLASLDAAQAWLRHHGRQTVEFSLQILMAYAEVATEPWLNHVAAQQVGHSEKFFRDPFRIWIPTGSYEVSRAIADALEQQGLMLEYADSLGVLLVLSLDIKERDLNRWLSVIRSQSLPQVDSTLSIWQDANAPQLLVSPRQAAFASHERIPLTRSVGRIAGQTISPYPPGTPLVYPGQMMDEKTVARLMHLSETGYQVVGIDSTRGIDVLHL